MKRIHIIEDDQVLIDILTRFTQAVGEWEVSISSSATQALAIQAEHDFDAIVSDVFLPDMPGVVFFKKLQKTAENCKIIMISGRCTPEQTKLISENAHCFLAKPFSFEEFKEALQN